LKAIVGAEKFGTHTKHTLRSIEQLADACAKIKARGFSLDEAEFLEEVRCVRRPSAIRRRDCRSHWNFAAYRPAFREVSARREPTGSGATDHRNPERRIVVRIARRFLPGDRFLALNINALLSLTSQVVRFY
jgi:Bacterial transcriptional regulator